MNDARQTYFVGRHREGVNITLVRENFPQLIGLQCSEKFRGNVADITFFCASSNLRPPEHRTERFRVHGVDIIFHASPSPSPPMGHDNIYDPKVPQACTTILADQDVSLERKNISTCFKWRTCSQLTGLTLPCTIPRECRYRRPFAASASYRKGFKLRFCEDNGGGYQPDVTPHICNYRCIL